MENVFDVISLIFARSGPIFTNFKTGRAWAWKFCPCKPLNRKRFSDSSCILEVHNLKSWIRKHHMLYPFKQHMLKQKRNFLLRYGCNKFQHRNSVTMPITILKNKRCKLKFGYFLKNLQCIKNGFMENVFSF